MSPPRASNARTGVAENSISNVNARAIVNIPKTCLATANLLLCNCYLGFPISTGDKAILALIVPVTNNMFMVPGCQSPCRRLAVALDRVSNQASCYL